MTAWLRRRGRVPWLGLFGIGLMLSVLPSDARANAVADACRQAGRDAATPELCACIGAAAELSLSALDQERAAGFFSDPHSAQETRQSNRRRDEVFWERYRDFIQTAEDICG
ncbi:MAG: hypothetical protein AAFN09_06985 [Pseudomonadota bacterium]